MEKEKNIVKEQGQERDFRSCWVVGVVVDEFSKKRHARFYTRNHRGEAAREAVYRAEDQCRRANNEDESHAGGDTFGS